MKRNIFQKNDNISHSCASKGDSKLHTRLSLIFAIKHAFGLTFQRENAINMTSHE